MPNGGKSDAEDMEDERKWPRVHTTEKCHQSRRAEAPTTEIIVAALSHRLFCFVL